MRYRIKLALILISMLIWGVSYPVVKILLNSGVQPITLATLRNLIFIPLLFYILAGKRYARYSRSDMILYVSIAFFTVFLPNISQNIGMKYTSASISSVIQSTSPIFTVMLAFIFLREARTLNKIVGSLVGLIGTVFLTTGGSFNFDATVFGNLLILISSISYAISGILIKVALSRIDPLDLLCFEVIFGFFMLLIPNMVLEDLSAVISFGIDVWMYILFLSVFAGFLASIMYYMVLREEEISYLAIFSYLIPVFAIISSYVMLHEVLEIKDIIFTLVILSGIVITEVGRKER
ncbi:MAG: DMT family transporter [Thermoplasmata archaeon]|nr:DMT family transporter [Thermoplasmata archaeon]